MSIVERLADKAELADLLTTDTALHIYEIGDLDPFFWPHTRWFGLRDARGRVGAIALLYSGMDLPTVLVFERRNMDVAEALVTGLSPHLPPRFTAHLSPNLTRCVEKRWRCVSNARFLRMVLTDRALLETTPTAGHPLGPEHLAEVVAFYAHSYPGNWFDPRMLETGCYVGIRRHGMLACTAGVHVYSSDHRVAALGNVATDPSLRGQGLAQRATAQLCHSLFATVDTIGLNVKADNAAAIACYRKLGFEVVAEFEEAMFESSPQARAAP